MSALAITPSHHQNTHVFAHGRKNMNDIFNNYVCSASGASPVCDHEFFYGWPWKTIGTSFILHQALYIIPNPSVNSNWSYSPEMLNSGQNRQFFVLCDLEICSSFAHHFKAMGESQTAEFGPKYVIFLSCVTFRFDRWPWKTIGHLLYNMWSFVHHFKTVGEF